MKLNEKIMNLRKMKGLSQEDFGNQLNVSRQAVSKWESGQSQPSIDNINEIANFFNVSYEYLLDDSINDINDVKEKIITSKSKIKTVLKFFLILLIIYLAICVCKFIIIYKNYKLANSFSENNYTYFLTYKQNGNTIGEFTTTKIDDNLLEKSINLNDTSKEPNNFHYKDFTNKLYYTISYEESNDRYIVYDETVALNEDELNTLFNSDNEIKKITLDYIPSDFKNIFLESLNPMYFVSSKNITIYTSNGTTKIHLTNDGLLEKIQLKTKDNNTVEAIYSYDYVPAHFKDKKLINPFEDEKYKDKLVKFEDLIDSNE